jgi:hypothetical protein
MDEMSRDDKEKWEHMNDNMGLLFEKMAQIELNQRKMDTRFDTTGKVFEQMLKDQQAL